MRAILGIIAYSIAGLLILGEFRDGCAEERTVTAATVCGRIVTIEGIPLSGSVSIRPPWCNTYTADAGADGRFRLTVKPQEVVRMYGSLESGGLIVKAKDLAPVVISLPVLPAGGEVRLGDVFLGYGTFLRGQVLSPQGGAVAGAEVTVRTFANYLGNTVGHMLPDTTLVADEQGGFQTPALPCCQLGLEVSAPGFQLAGGPLQLDGWARRLELQPIRLQPEYPVHGHVRAPNGQAIAGARVRWFREDHSDAEGNFQLHGLERDYRVQVIVSADGYRVHNEIHRGETNMNIVLSPAHYLTGRVTDARSGKPIRLRQVVLCEYSLDADGQPRVDGCRNARFRQPASGQFMVEHFGPARYHVLFKADDYQDRELFLDLLDSDRDWDVGGIELWPLVQSPDPAIVVQRIRGRVTRGGEPVARATVSLWSPGRKFAGRENAAVHYGRLVPPPPSCREMKVTGEDGEFEFSAPYQGEWLVRADCPEAAPTVVGPVNVKRGEDAEQAVEIGESGSLVGRVRGIAFSAPGVLWAIVFDDRAIMEVAQVDPGGEFRFDRMPAGTYGVKIGHCAMNDSEIYGGLWDTLADPWNRAEKVEITAGSKATVELDARHK
ncbi:MAG: carboxypeptidase regulatory-like domain-containing protein [Pirellulales bacterium]|nr:carboxypeptidase regulatory-like domain-containing protein [Pirellulales bacterium]